MPKRIRDRPLPTAILALAMVREQERLGRRLRMQEKLKVSKLAADVLSLPVELAIAHANGAGADGAWPTQVEYAGYWGITERTAQRRWALYRQVMGADADPYALARALFVDYSARLADGDTSVGWEASGSLLAA